MTTVRSLLWYSLLAIVGVLGLCALVKVTFWAQSELDRGAILNTVLVDWMSKDDPYSYLTIWDGQRERAVPRSLQRLVVDLKGAPAGFVPHIPGIAVHQGAVDQLELGDLYVSNLELKAQDNGEIGVTFFHTGHGFIGGATVTYRVKRVGGQWKPEFVGWFDP